MSDEKTTESKPSPFVRKKLTPFLAHEMIYDFANGTLEGERRQALEEFLAKDQESQILLKNIQAAQSYSKNLTGLQVAPEILSQLLEAESAVSLGKKYSSWREWPETLRWSVTAIVLSAVVAGAVAVVPWAKFSPRKSNGPENVEVAQIPQPKLDETEALAANEDNGSGDEAPDDVSDESSGDDVADTESGDDGGDDSVAATKVAGLAAASKAKPSPTPTASPQAIAQATRPGAPPESLGRSMPAQFVSVNLPKPVSPPAKPAAPSPTPAPGTNASSQIALSETPDTHDSRDAKARGFVYRAFMTLNDLEEIGPKIKDEITALGGEKAGEVELGWKRGTGRYYHFTLPESNEKKVLERLQVYGPVRISKDPHPRVMPPGQVRFIYGSNQLTVPQRTRASLEDGPTATASKKIPVSETASFFENHPHELVLSSLVGAAHVRHGLLARQIRASDRQRAHAATSRQLSRVHQHD